MKYILRLTFILVFFSSGCTKFLDAVPDKSLTVPTTVADYQALLENELMFNNSPAMGEFGTDDLYLPDALWASKQAFFRNAYVWAKDVHEGATSASWNNPYNKIYYSNIVLDGLDKLNDKALSANINKLKGWALFCRANAFYDVQEVFGQPYKPSSAKVDLGIPLKLNSNLQEKVNRASVEDTYDQIVKDLETALPLVPVEFQKVNRNNPSKIAVYALLARVYLTMQNYEKALENADHCLQLYNVLLDYNTVNPAAKASFTPLIDEVLYNSIQLSYADNAWQIDKQLYESFTANDLRKVLFFTEDMTAKTVVFKGFYSATQVGFDGLTTDETYLIKAECEARLGHDAESLKALNTLLLKRFKTGTYIPYSVINTSDVLRLVLVERRKECIFRNLRWSDLRRLNQDNKYAKTLTRTVNGIQYELPPNDSRYTLPIPDNEIRITGIQQNAR